MTGVVLEVFLHATCLNICICMSVCQSQEIISLDFTSGTLQW